MWQARRVLPSILIDEAMHGRIYAFVESCHYGIAYLIHTEWDVRTARADWGTHPNAAFW